MLARFWLLSLSKMNSLKNKLEILEREAIINTLRECGWVQSRAARELGITERMIGYKIKKYKIKMKREN